MVPSARRYGRILLQDLADTLEGPERRRSNRVRDRVVGARPSTLGPHEIVSAVLLEHERAFDVSLRCDLLERGAIGERQKAGEVFVEARDVAVAPPTVNDIVCAVGVSEYELVDRLGPVVELVDERPAEVIDERAGRRACTGHAD